MVKVIDNWEVADAGSVAVVASDRARYARITLKRDGSITLTVSPARAGPYPPQESQPGLLG